MRRWGQRYRYRLTGRLVAVGIIAYVAIVGDERVRRHPELFPISSWSLFSTVPNIVDDYAIRVRSVGGVPVKGVVWFEQAPEIFRFASDHQAHMLIHELGRALEHKPGNDGVIETDTATLRRSLERMYLGVPGGAAVEYEIVARRYDPLVRWRSTTLIDQHSVASFISGGPIRVEPAGPGSVLASGPLVVPTNEAGQ